MRRRKFIKQASALTSGLASAAVLPNTAMSKEESRRTESDPHFFIQIIIPQGMDPTYLFDARPIAMTQSNMVQNYWPEDQRSAESWVGVNGQKTLVSQAANRLKPLSQYFSILNGLVVSPSFDGHEQNLNVFVTGNPFGGNSYLPPFNTQSERPGILDTVMLGEPIFGLHIRNGEASLSLDPGVARSLFEVASNTSGKKISRRVLNLVNRRLQVNSELNSQGLFSRGSKLMHRGISASEVVEKRLGKLYKQPNQSSQIPPNYARNSEDGTDSQIETSLKLAMRCFQQGITTTALLGLKTTGSIDAHGFTDAAAQPKIYNDVVTAISKFINLLKDTPFREETGQSFFDVTTFMIGSEFGRTLRQSDKAIDKTGTDHNPLGNSILIGGKGIRSDLVVGSSDLQWDRQRNHIISPSAFHASKDPKNLKAMGLPLNFQTGRAITGGDDLGGFDTRLTMANVSNSMIKNLGLSSDYYLKTSSENGSPNARVVKALLKS